MYELDAQDVEGLDMESLTSMQEEEHISVLQFDHGEYTPLELFLQNLALLPDKPSKVSIKALNVNGRVVCDKMDKYLAYPAESSSGLKEVLKTPRHYLVYKNQEIKPRNTSHFELGTFTHSAFLEPTKFDKVRVEPKYNEATNEGLRMLIAFYWELLQMQPSEDLTELKQQALRERLQELRATSEELGYTIIDQEDNTIINIIRSTYKVYGEGILPKIFRYAKSEVSMYGTDPQTNLRTKIRPDAILLEENFGINAIVSFKTTCATSLEAFMRDCAKYRYELSEGMYLDVASNVTGRKFTATLMVMVQTCIPFQVALIYWNDEDLQVGKYKYYQAMDMVKQCRDANSYPGFDSKAAQGAYGIIEGKLPDYIKAELLPQYLPNS